MSLPKHHTPTLSSSSSKQSLRGNRTSSPRPRTIDRRLSEQQRQQQQIDHGTALPDTVQTGDNSGSLEEQQEDVNQSEPGFQPFFTLIEDANSSEYYHPTVHYIFSDDDPDLVTEAAMRALENGSDHSRRPHQEHSSQGYIEEGLEAGQSGSRKQSLLPPPVPGVRERYIILDVERTGPQHHGQGASSAPDATTQVATAAAAASMSTSPAQQQQQQQQNTAPQQAGQAFRITSAHSLTPDWQVLSTKLSPAPSFDTLHNNHAAGEPSPNGALMLRIEGTSGFPRDIAPGRGEDNKDHTLEELMEQFEKRMGELRRVIEAGGNHLQRRPGLNRTGDMDDVNPGSENNNAANILEGGEGKASDETT